MTPNTTSASQSPEPGQNEVFCAELKACRRAMLKCIAPLVLAGIALLAMHILRLCIAEGADWAYGALFWLTVGAAFVVSFFLLLFGQQFARHLGRAYAVFSEMHQKDGAR